MKTIILCGGLGSRLREETEFKPKPMIEIGGKPILWHIMQIYAHYNYKDFLLALGYKANYIKDYFLHEHIYASDFSVDTKNGKVTGLINQNNGGADDLRITFCDTGLETDTGERILKLKKYITNDDFMVTYGDGVADINIKKLTDLHFKMGKIATITGVRPLSKYGLIGVDRNKNLVTKFKQKPRLFDYISGGFMVFKKEVFKFLRKGEMIEDVLFKLVKKKEVVLFRHDGYWQSMDTYNDMVLLNKQWADNPKWKIW